MRFPRFFSSAAALRTRVQVARERLVKFDPKRKQTSLMMSRTEKFERAKKYERAKGGSLVKGGSVIRNGSVVAETMRSLRPSECTFQNDLVSPTIRAYMREAGFVRSSEIQKLLYEKILLGKDVFGGAETGSGKTLAYLLPLVQRLKQSERDGKEFILVCVPTKELVQQVLQVSKALAHHCKFRPRTFAQEDWAEGDVLVGLPREFMGIARSVLFEEERERIRAIVVDEADTLLMDSGFAEDVRLVLDALSSKVQKIVTSATMPPNLLKKLRVLIPDIEMSITKGFLKPVSTLKQLFMDLKVPQAQKPQRCIELLQTDEHLSTQHNLIFCNNINSARYLYERLLPDSRLNVAMLHGRVSPQQRMNLLKAFAQGRIRTLIATDLLARGVDLRVDNVVLYDFPHTLAEYLHRVGRTARAGKAGRVFALVTSRDRPFFHKIKAMLDPQ